MGKISKEKNAAKVSRKERTDVTLRDLLRRLEIVSKVDEWFEIWIDNIVCDLAPNALRNYRKRYEHNIQPVTEKTRIVDVKPLHCKAVLNRMNAVYSGSTILQSNE